MVDRGRVWRNLRLANINPRARCPWMLLTGATATSNGSDRNRWRTTTRHPAGRTGRRGGRAGGSGGGPAPLGLGTGAIVYAFKEQPINDLPPASRLMLYEDSQLPEQDTKGQCRLPTFYMGEYRITSDPVANPSTIELTPTLPLSPTQLEQLQQDDGATWAMYEVMPVDSHEALQGITAEQMQLLLPAPRISRQRSINNSSMNMFAIKRGRTKPIRPSGNGCGLSSSIRTRSTWMFRPPRLCPTRLMTPVADPSRRPCSRTSRRNSPREMRRCWTSKRVRNWSTRGVAEQVEPIYQRRLRDYAEYFRNFAREFEAIDRQVATAQEDLNRINES